MYVLDADDRSEVEVFGIADVAKRPSSLLQTTSWTHVPEMGPVLYCAPTSVLLLQTITISESEICVILKVSSSDTLCREQWSVPSTGSVLE